MGSQRGSYSVRNNAKIRIGVGSPGSDRCLYYPGLIDDVRIYNRPLSESEVQALYGLRGMYVDYLETIIGKKDRETEVLEFAKKNNMTYLALYGAGKFLLQGTGNSKVIGSSLRLALA